MEGPRAVRGGGGLGQTYREKLAVVGAGGTLQRSWNGFYTPVEWEPTFKKLNQVLEKRGMLQSPGPWPITAIYTTLGALCVGGRRDSGSGVRRGPEGEGLGRRFQRTDWSLLSNPWVLTVPGQPPENAVLCRESWGGRGRKRQCQPTPPLLDPHRRTWSLPPWTPRERPGRKAYVELFFLHLIQRGQKSGRKASYRVGDVRTARALLGRLHRSSPPFTRPTFECCCSAYPLTPCARFSLVHTI